MSNDNFIIPEYKIDLLNKSKKLINSVENINSVIQVNKTKNILSKIKKPKEKITTKSKEKIKKTKARKKVRTLWVRRKKKIKLSLLMVSF